MPEPRRQRTDKAAPRNRRALLGAALAAAGGVAGAQLTGGGRAAEAGGGALMMGVINDSNQITTLRNDFSLIDFMVLSTKQKSGFDPTSDEKIGTAIWASGRTGVYAIGDDLGGVRAEARKNGIALLVEGPTIFKDGQNERNSNEFRGEAFFMKGVTLNGPVQVTGNANVAGRVDFRNPATFFSDASFEGKTSVKEKSGAPTGVGLAAEAGLGVALMGSTTGGTGVSGSGDIGVLGKSNSGRGVLGETGDGVGVLARATGPGLALSTEGAVRFSSAGSSSFARGQAQKVVTGVATPPGSKILVTLSQNPGPGNALKYVKRTSDTGFTVYLLKPVKGGVSFSYFVLA